MAAMSHVEKKGMVGGKKKQNQMSEIKTKQPWMYGPRAKVKIQTSEDNTEVSPTRYLFLGCSILSNLALR